jgi:hypothetical protein
MERLSRNLLGLLLALMTAAASGCASPGTELDLANHDPAQDHRKIASYYSREAERLRQTAEELSARIAVYERLFGRTSDWVIGTQLLAQSYEEAAKEHARKASEHLEFVKGRQPAPLASTQHP